MAFPGQLQAGDDLIGTVGSDYVLQKLRGQNPKTAVTEVQQAACLRQPLCQPVLGMLHQMGITHAQSHIAVLQKACDSLLKLIDSMSHEGLLQLLDRSFPYIGIPELRCVPMSVLGRLSKVPVHYLKQLSHDADLFSQLPANVHQQVWELDKGLMQQHVLPLLHAYCGDAPLLRRVLHMDAMSPNLPRAAAPVARKTLRQNSAALQQLVATVGSSRQIYKAMVDLCSVTFRGDADTTTPSRRPMLATLRGQLLMALHDRQAGDITCAEACHTLAWSLDTCVRECRLDSRHAQELAAFLETFRGARHASRTKESRGASGDAESAGGVAPGRDDPQRAVGDAALILCDLPTRSLIAGQVIKQLTQCVEASSQPAQDDTLRLLMTLLLMSLDARRVMRNNRVPRPSELLRHTFYPTLCCVILESTLLDSEATALDLDPGGQYGLLEGLSGAVVQEPAACVVLQMYSLERIALKDWCTAQLVLDVLADALSHLQPDSHADWAPFAFSLARRIGPLAKTGVVAPGQPLWKTAMDKIVLRLLDADAVVHEDAIKVLRVAAVKQEQPLSQFAAALEATLQFVEPDQAYSNDPTGQAAVTKQYVECFSRFPDLKDHVSATPRLARFLPADDP